MTWTNIHRPDEGFLLSEATGFRSRDTVRLKAGREYEAGTVLEAEVAGNPAIATGFHVPFDGGVDAVVLCRRTDATDGAVDAAIIGSDAEVKPGDLVLAAGITIADATPALAANGIKVR